MDDVLLFLGVASAALAAVVHWPARRPAVPAGLSFFLGFFAGEPAAGHLAWQVPAAAALVAAGALETWHGQLGLGLLALGWLGAAVALWQMRPTARVVADALREAHGIDWSEDERRAARVGWRALWPLGWGQPGVRRVAERDYAGDGLRRHRIDVYDAPTLHDETHPKGAKPVFLYIHGGGWVIGNKREQGRPLVHLLASRGWLCFSTNYRLSPRATFPEHIIDVKRAIAWVRQHAPEYGGDASFLALGGGSAGGHLAALAALTPDEAAWQPGFEGADTRVQACLPFYGVFDLLNRHGQWPHGGLRLLWEGFVMKRPVAEARDDYDHASPLSHLRPDAPPFLMMNGTRDTMVPPAESRTFAPALREVSHSPVTHIELPGGQHAFDIVVSARSWAADQGAWRWLEAMRARGASRTE